MVCIVSNLNVTASIASSPILPQPYMFHATRLEGGLLHRPSFIESCDPRSIRHRVTACSQPGGAHEMRDGADAISTPIYLAEHIHGTTT